MPGQKAGAAARRRFLHAFKAALAVEPWNPQDFPVRRVLEKRREFNKAMRGGRRRWGWSRLDRWGITLATKDNADHLDGYASWTFGPDELGLVRGSLYHAQNLSIRLTAISNAAWAAGIRKLEVELTSLPTAHDMMELAAEAGEWYPLATSKSGNAE